MRRPTFAWALAGSAVVHAALAAVVLHGGGGSGAHARSAAPLTAALQSLPAPVPLQSMALQPLLVASAASALPLLPPAAELAPLQPTPGESEAAAGALDVDARIADNLDRVGPMLERQLTEFTAEVGTPVQLAEPIRAHYPLSALREGRDGDVAVWVIVNSDGAAEEIQVTEGTSEFADEAVAAVKAARFIPATNKRRPIRFPVALEFRFVAGSTRVQAAADSPAGR